MRNLPRGFTLIEMMTVVALIAIIGALAAPDLRAFVVRNKVAGVSNEFSAALQQARSLAVSRNSCVSLCVASSNNAATCMANDVDDVNFLATGWLIFQNPGCDAAKTDPAAAVAGPVLQQRSGEAGSYVLRASAAALNIVLFDPRGYANLAAEGSFQIEPPPGSEASYRRTICLAAAGRSTVRQFVDPCT
ncbi:MAG: GspH/FimT family pseudopilin [Rhizobacter sp.]